MSAIEFAESILQLERERSVYQKEADIMRTVLAAVLLANGGKSDAAFSSALVEGLAGGTICVSYGATAELLYRDGQVYLPVTSRGQVEILMSRKKAVENAV